MSSSVGGMQAPGGGMGMNMQGFNQMGGPQGGAQPPQPPAYMEGQYQASNTQQNRMLQQRQIMAMQQQQQQQQQQQMQPNMMGQLQRQMSGPGPDPGVAMGPTPGQQPQQPMNYQGYQGYG